MAKKAGVTMNECRLYESAGGHHFMTKRFDRENGRKLHMQSLGALAHISYQEPGICGYELAPRHMILPFPIILPINGLERIR